ncbi:hypothetical protein CYLTODRAFT_488341 [Cylindrobasidium torrendii FP15055 ss-10]|uniref:Uncharacterized protein n=1 Tax=Cylindrobasidium torrendii FP15055 ss-10 TaxID=1314674 RepID=A0A0D7BJ14_9AGAR|nr:hypothetical protein CYLTODRAFT_488341 [Cylindrobasidium torrendii FP15055 ss-10]
MSDRGEESPDAERASILKSCLVATFCAIDEHRAEILDTTERSLGLAQETLKEETDNLHAELRAAKAEMAELDDARQRMAAELASIRDRVVELEAGRINNRALAQGDVSMHFDDILQVEVLTVGPGDKRVRMTGLPGGMQASVLA